MWHDFYYITIVTKTHIGFCALTRVLEMRVYRPHLVLRQRSHLPFSTLAEQIVNSSKMWSAGVLVYELQTIIWYRFAASYNVLIWRWLWSFSYMLRVGIAII